MTEHRCDTPPSGLPGMVWICPECGTEWWADDPYDWDNDSTVIEWRIEHSS